MSTSEVRDPLAVWELGVGSWELTSVADQRIGILLSASSSSRGIVPRGRVRSLPISKCPLFGAGVDQHACQAEVALVTARLVIDPIRLRVLDLELLPYLPRAIPRRRIVNR